MSGTIPLAQYLFTRLHQLNCRSIHGVPGDFTLRALDTLPNACVKWIGNASEICAGYAADGYARAAALARRTRVSAPRVGALYTTYGVGELSAINAVAGAYAENSPLVHFVGTPSRQQWRGKQIMHHTMADGRFHVSAEMAKQITCAQADLSCDDVGEAVDRYDRALQECVKQSKPIYVNLPCDMVTQSVPEKLLDQPLQIDRTSNDAATEDEFIDMVVKKIKYAKKPLIIADGLAYPFDLASEVTELVRMTAIPAMCFSAGKGVVDESLPSFQGPLAAATDYSRSTDLALLFGPLLSDTNTAAWSAVPDPRISISFNLDNVTIGDKSQVHPVNSKALLQKLLKRLRNSTSSAATQFKKPSKPTVTISPISKIGQDAFWSRISSFHKPHDTLLLANGTPLIGGRDISLPSPVQVIASGIWCSIGSMLPCAQGVAAAKRDHNIPGRTILFEGDGSFQVTCQSISDIIRYKLDVTIFICNNRGYTYERLLHGLQAEYNDVPAWRPRYVEAARFFGAREDESTYPVFSRTMGKD
ncbi:Putative thiamine pyrophosphate enzyme TPP-binding, thiamine pyrophosphate enzyme, central [Septoria linicola]|uniref:Pyruvate decarboxylase n=1 Tax=Septoria linicola TaxID=215465 RepID=A0A9Q9ARJ7_9PEZI|nr:putative thiamine pyrophosphate enzyme TPP-binding, thiamine pyrophosphate enzyme, central [Septoria linicola]USW50757.1 Putative thiamine pyrophosphate enzyme TPP-binding, thiamine pyrophosphate enzyme, central [Septoria linicola]